ncbi:MAG: MFS transporter, partial [Bacillota bacterium]
MGARRIFLLGGVGFLTAFGAHMIAVGLPDFGRTHGLGYAGMGVLLAAYNLAEMGIKPLAGRLSDGLGPRPVMLWGTAVFTVSSFLFLVLPARILLGIRLAQGMGAGALSVASLTLLVASFPRRLGTVLGLYQALKGTGYVVAPLVGGFFRRHGRFPAVFLLAGGAGLVLLVFQLLFASWLDVRPSLAGEPAAPSRRGRLWPWYLANFTDTALLGILLGFLPVRADELGYPPRTVGLLLGATSLGFLLVQPLAGALADRLGRRAAVLWGLTVSSLGTGMLGCLTGAGLAATGMIGGLGLGVAWTNSLARVGEGAGEGRLGGDLGLAGACKDAGDILGPLSFGLLAARAGLSSAFFTWAVVGMAVAGIIIFFGREARRVNSSKNLTQRVTDHSP